MSSSGAAQWLDCLSLVLLLRCFLYTIFRLDIPEANRNYLSLPLASELEGIELQSPENLPSKMLIEGELMVP